VQHRDDECHRVCSNFPHNEHRRIDTSSGIGRTVVLPYRPQRLSARRNLMAPLNQVQTAITEIAGVTQQTEHRCMSSSNQQ
jgi:hypothetical protein